MKNLIIIGAGGFAREVYWYAQNSVGYAQTFIIKGFLDGTVKLEKSAYNLLPMPVLGDVKNYSIDKDDVFVIAIANSKAKKEISKIILNKNGEFINIIHSTALLAPTAKVGVDIVMGPYSMIGPNARVNDHIMLNAHSSIGHDSIIESFSSIMYNVAIAGHVNVGESTLWGDNSVAIPGCCIGNYATMAAGCVVLNKVNDNITVAGVPAKPIR
jgi:sugar O-acyltransferase (sialic acid O-acetyltransferase NeuD family)